MNVAERIKKLRQQRHLTQYEFSERIGVGRSVVGLYETGKRVPSNAVLCRMADFFHVSTDYLLGKSDVPDVPAFKPVSASIDCETENNSTDLLDCLFHDEPDFLAKIRAIDIKGKINEPGMILKLTERQKDRIRDIIRLTVKEAEMNTETHTAKVVIKKG